MRKSVVTVFGIIALVMAFAMPASAGTDTGGMTASCTIDATGSITVGNMVFGNTTGGSTNVDVTATISATVTNGSAYTIAINDGTYFASGSASQRDMKASGSADYLDYEIYKESGRTNRYGSSAAEDIDDTGNGGAQSHDSYGRVATVGLSLPTDSYSDSLTVTLTF